MRAARPYWPCFGLIFCATSVYAEALPVHDLNPLLSGYELPAAQSATPSGTSLSLGLAIGNISLDQHSPQEGLQLDGELQRWQLSFATPLSNTLELRVDLPYLDLSGGHLDNFIESFHDTFGLPNGNRNLWPVGRLWIQHVRNGVPDYDLSDSQRGLGDLTLRLGKHLGASPDHNTVLWISLKLPTGDANRLTGSGAADIAISLATSQRSGTRVISRQQLSVSRLGKSERLTTQQLTWVWSGSLGLDALLTPHWSAAMQLDGHTRIFNSDLRALGNVLQLSFGPSYRSGAWNGALLISEDIAVDTAPDVQLQLQLTHSF
jgi:Protein of unknown function (DUF3187)